ncbi:hypothetical protein CEP53_010548 [Fusarium sp. AF-6]|nr:hypothetical protein CEP53_010548 [Fusarium sp. AF-6]
MPSPPTQEQLKRRRNLEIAKRQATVLVSIMATIFILCPECLKVYRNLCFVPALAWLTGLAFDLIGSLSNTWDNIPAVLKYFIPFDMNIPITAPFDQISTFICPLLSKASTEAKRVAQEAIIRITAFKRVVFLVLANWFLRQLGQDPVGENSSERSEDGTPGPAPVSDRWYGILVMTPPVHDYGSLPLDTNAKEPSDPIQWDSHETSSVPSISPPSDFRVHLSFCLVPKVVWESQDTTLVEKFKAGLYWDMRGENCGTDGELWSEARVQRITGIEILGLVDEEQDTVNSCHTYFASLRQGWNYKNISWNDVDFAIILGFLVTAPQAAQTTKDLFTCFSRLRMEQAQEGRVLVPMKGFFTCWCVCAAAGAVTVLTGGLAAPVTTPLFVGSNVTGMGFGFAGLAIGVRDQNIWEKRIEFFQALQRQFPQLEELLLVE